MSAQLLSITDKDYELIKITLKVLGKFCKFDEIKIYEDESYFEVCTVNRSEKYITKTRIGKVFWRVKDSILQKAGEKEIKLK